MEIWVRDMRRDEARDFLALHHASVRGLAAAAYPAEVIADWAPLPVTEAAVAAFLANPDGELRLVAERDGALAGVGALVSATGELRACYVASEAARRGVGAALVREIEARARAAGLTGLWLDASLNAESFYRAMGYRSDRRAEHSLPTGLRMACVRMSRDIGI